MRNAFKHLTDTAIGFDSQETQDLDFESVSTSMVDIGKENQTTLNSTPKTHVSFHLFIFFKFQF